MNRSVRLGYLTRAVASLAVVFVTALTAMATLTVAGVLAEPIGIVGLFACVLSVSAFLVVGVGVVRTGAYSRRIGGLLLVNVVALLIVFFGRTVVPLGLVATVVPTLVVLLYLGVAYDLRALGVGVGQPTTTTDRETYSETAPWLVPRYLSSTPSRGRFVRRLDRRATGRGPLDSKQVADGEGDEGQGDDDGERRGHRLYARDARTDVDDGDEPQHHE